jgi:hypothetical protein
MKCHPQKQYESIREVYVDLSFLMDPYLIYFNVALLRPSTMIKNNKRDKGHPSLGPLVGDKNFEVDPLIKIEMTYRKGFDNLVYHWKSHGYIKVDNLEV